MNLEKDKHLPRNRYRLHLLIICIVIITMTVLTFTTDLFTSTRGGVSSLFYQILFLLGALVMIISLLAMLSRIIKILNTLHDNSNKLAEITQSMEIIQADLNKIDNHARLSEVVKAIAFGEADRQSLRQVVFAKLQTHDYDAANEIIEKIAKLPEYKEFAEKLKNQAEDYRHATDQERLNQLIVSIEKLIEECQWNRASVQIEGMIRAYPESEQAKSMRQVLSDRKQERKRILLAAWDDAIQNQETDRSLDILKELDSYLSPNEALALQEAASDVFRTKLHNLGVQFSIAVTEKRWSDAFEIGQQIVTDFPNSRMSGEISSKLQILQHNVQMQNS